MINNPELLILALNLTVILLAYFIVFPLFCGANLNKIFRNDVLAVVTILSISGTVFWGREQEFNLLVISVNWFWFTLISYSIMEIPFMLYYIKKHNMYWSDKDKDKDK
jgi:hypothetical protein